MSERKVLNKYYPPDFDPALLVRNKKPRDRQIVVRVMLPMSVRCTICGEWVYKGKKFNARKEEAIGEDYLGIKVWRFYIKCTNCMGEITFKTDPKNSNYVVEAGAQRNFEPWRQHEEANRLLDEAKKEKEEDDTIKQLENRTLANRREMESADALEDLRDINARQANLDSAAVIEALGKQRDEEEELRIAALEKDLETLDDAKVVKRLDDSAPPIGDTPLNLFSASARPALAAPQASSAGGILNAGASIGVKIAVKPVKAKHKKRKHAGAGESGAVDKKQKSDTGAAVASAPQVKAPAAAASSGLGLLASYADDSEDSS